MIATFARLTRTSLVVVLCVLAACLPGRALALKLCLCEGVTVSSCPCAFAEAESDPAAAPSACCAIGATDLAAEPAHDGCPADDDCDGADDSCCRELAIDDLAPRWEGRADAGAEEVDPEPTPYGQDAGSFVDASAVAAQHVRSTGPPGDRHRLRRALLERASIVLLI